MNLTDDLQANTEKIIQSFKDIPDDQFNARPEEDKWSVGEIVEHIFRSEFAIPRLLNGPAKAAHRDPAEKITMMDEKLSDKSAKYSAFGSILPSKNEKNKTELMEKFSTNREKIISLIETQNPDEICTLFEHPFFGELTRLEWVKFCILHTERHYKQIQSVVQKLEQQNL